LPSLLSNNTLTVRVDNKLTVKQARFAEEYQVDGHGKRSAIAADYSASTAEAAASRLLRSVKV
jgi:phage terminase small subunit